MQSINPSTSLAFMSSLVVVTNSLSPFSAVPTHTGMGYVTSDHVPKGQWPSSPAISCEELSRVCNHSYCELTNAHTSHAAAGTHGSPLHPLAPTGFLPLFQEAPWAWDSGGWFDHLFIHRWALERHFYLAFWLVGSLCINLLQKEASPLRAVHICGYKHEDAEGSLKIWPLSKTTAVGPP